MKTYKILVGSSGRVEAVKQGWSWPAFFFNMFWLPVKKLWGWRAVFWGAWAAMAVTTTFLGVQGVEGAVNIVVGIVLGQVGNQMREKNLVSRGFEVRDTVQAGNVEAALAAWEKGGSVS